MSNVYFPTMGDEFDITRDLAASIFDSFGHDIEGNLLDSVEEVLRVAMEVEEDLKEEIEEAPGGLEEVRGLLNQLL